MYFTSSLIFVVLTQKVFNSFELLFIIFPLFLPRVWYMGGANSTDSLCKKFFTLI